MKRKEKKIRLLDTGITARDGVASKKLRGNLK